MSAGDHLNPSEFSDEQLNEKYSQMSSNRREQISRWRDAHQSMGFAFSGPGSGKMSYEYGASPDFTSWGGGPVTVEGGSEPDHVYRVEGEEGMRSLQETGQLGSNFGRSAPGHTYTHVSRYPEGKYADPGAHVLRVKNAPGRFRAKTTLDRAYGVAESPIPSEDVEDLGPARDYPAMASGRRAATPPVSIDEYVPPTTPEYDAVAMEHFNRDFARRWKRGGNPFADL